jgi:tRNA (Thr-GGU) A37 N-methylase|tara:strand:- start:169 stop:336 length:168 start_codon:yes stop_codon:yes gene_type:complete
MMNYFEKVFAEMKRKYDLDDNTPVYDLSFYLDDSDWQKLTQAMKYPNGILREVQS